MIIYIATYPRCGNSWLRLMIGMNWRFLTSNGYHEDYASLSAALENFSLDSVPVEDVVGAVPASLKDQLVTYRPPNTDEVRLLVKPGCLAFLDDEARDFLAALPHKILVKTHDHPPENPRPGEIAVQMVRHPGAAIASYYRMERDFGIEGNGFPSLASMIKGQCNYGSWKDYHEAWLNTSMKLLRVTYEDAHADELGVSSTIGEFLGLDGGPTRAGFFDARNAAAPKRYPGGTVDGWIKNFDPDHLRLLRATHKQAANALGYSIPFHPDEKLIVQPAVAVAEVAGSAGDAAADGVGPRHSDAILKPSRTEIDVSNGVPAFIKPRLDTSHEGIAERFRELDEREQRIRKLLEARRQMSQLSPELTVQNSDAND